MKSKFILIFMMIKSKKVDNFWEFCMLISVYVY